MFKCINAKCDKEAVGEYKACRDCINTDYDGRRGPVEVVSKHSNEDTIECSSCKVTRVIDPKVKFIKGQCESCYKKGWQQQNKRVGA